VAFGRVPFTDWSGTLTAHDRSVIAHALEAVGGADLAWRYVTELSDGERQLVMIARALAQEPSAMILDEITGFLDLPRRIEIMRVLRRAAHEANVAVLLSTHDLDLALRTADRIWLMPKDRPLRAAMPETLVLDGAFQAAFTLDDVAFDEVSGSFRVQHPRRWPVLVAGDRPAAMWTERALERYGFYAASNGEPSALRVDVTGVAAGLRWELHLDDECQRHVSLDDMIEALRDRRDRPRTTGA
jgi:iron complex transport system ATP-binding protein